MSTTSNLLSKFLQITSYRDIILNMKSTCVPPSETYEQRNNRQLLHTPKNFSEKGMCPAKGKICNTCDKQNHFAAAFGSKGRSLARKGEKNQERKANRHTVKLMGTNYCIDYDLRKNTYLWQRLITIEFHKEKKTSNNRTRTQPQRLKLEIKIWISLWIRG